MKTNQIKISDSLDCWVYEFPAQKNIPINAFLELCIGDFISNHIYRIELNHLRDIYVGGNVYYLLKSLVDTQYQYLLPSDYLNFNGLKIRQIVNKESKRNIYTEEKFKEIFKKQTEV